jgi:Flp pilus assembly protein CpaB
MPITMILSLLTGKAKKPLLIALAIAVVLLGLMSAYFYVEQQGYEHGYTVAEHQFLKEKDQAVAVAIKELKQKNKSNQQIAETYWKNELAKQPKIQTIEKRIIEYVQAQDPNDTHCQLDDNELFILQDLVAIANNPKTKH